MDFVALLDRCVGLEQAAGTLYETLADAFASDSELRRLWAVMATQEREHAHKLATWRALAAAEPAEHRPAASGFATAVAALESLLAGAADAATHARDPEDAFRIALALELSELDAIYTHLLQSSPIARFPDIEDTVRSETGAHHEILVRAILGRSRDQDNLARARLLEAAHAAG